MSALILVEKRSYIRIIAVDGQCGPLRKMHRQVVGLSRQDAIGVECDLCRYRHKTHWTKPLRGRQRWRRPEEGSGRVRDSGINDPSLCVAPSDPWPR